MSVLQLQLGVDESYSLLVAKNDDHSIIGEATIEVLGQELFGCSSFIALNPGYEIQMEIY